ncbi:MAG: SDR family NAD(P)-dependent oxidoreductase [Thiolinea sp.]
MAKVFFITGASKGFGRHWAETALQRGDRVAATARNPDDLQALTAEFGEAVLPLRLDVTDREQCFAAVQQAHEHFGRIDVLISNAGYGHFGFVEEITEQEARAQLETNVFGSLWVIQAVLPFMRTQLSGHHQVSASVASASESQDLSCVKWAVEGLCESLSKRKSRASAFMSPSSEPPFTTDWAQVSSVRSQQLPEYAQVREGFVANTKTFDRGNPAATGDALMQLVDMDHPPLRLMLGRMAWKVIEPAYNERLQTWREWLELAECAVRAVARQLRYRGIHDNRVDPIGSDQHPVTHQMAFRSSVW